MAEVGFEILRWIYIGNDVGEGQVNARSTS